MNINGRVHVLKSGTWKSACRDCGRVHVEIEIRYVEKCMAGYEWYFTGMYLLYL